MPKADVLALVQTLSNGTADPVTSEKFYNSTIIELALENWTTRATVVPLTKGQVNADLTTLDGSTTVDINALIYDDVELDEISARDLGSLDPHWREAQGRTRSYTFEDENSKVVALYPAPNIASNPSLNTVGEPLGADYTTYNAVCFYSFAALAPEQPPVYLELAIALRILAREHLRESDHADPEFAGVAQSMADLFKSLVA